MKIPSTFFVLLALGMALATVWGNEADASFTLTIPVVSSAALPPWLTAVSPGQVLPFSVALAPTAPGSILAVTVYFDDPLPSDSSFLRVVARDTSGDRLLSPNLFEGTGLPNQRTLSFPCNGPTTLLFDSPSASIRRLHFEWTEPKTVAVGPGAEIPALLLQSGKSVSASEAGGSAFASQSDQWRGQIVTATLADAPVRLDTSTAFIASFVAAPGWVRLEGFFEGSSLRHPPILWVNGKEVGEVALERPSLSDPGWFWNVADASKEPIYAGWLKGTVYIPASFFVTGDNRFQFALPEGAGAASIKDLKVEILPLSAAASPSVPANVGSVSASSEVSHAAASASP